SGEKAGAKGGKKAEQGEKAEAKIARRGARGEKAEAKGAKKAGRGEKAEARNSKRGERKEQAEPKDGKKKAEKTEAAHEQKTAELKKQGYQEHHIFSDKNDATKTHDAWTESGQNPQQKKNTIFLPKKSTTHATRSVHNGRHTQQVSDRNKEAMDAVVVRGKKE